MNPLARYFELTAIERRLFFSALLLGAVIRLALWTLPFRVTRAWVDWLRQPPVPERKLDRQHLRQVAWAVEAASRRIPRATCLTQSMVTHVLLGRLGQPSVLHLGAARNPDGKLEAHAWVETQGRIINGGAAEGFHRFIRLVKEPSLGTKVSSKSFSTNEAATMLGMNSNLS